MSIIEELETVGEFLTCSEAKPRVKNKFGAVQELSTCVGFVFCQDPGQYKNEKDMSTIEEIATVGEFLTCHGAEEAQSKNLVGAVDEMCTCCGFVCCQDPGRYKNETELSAVEEIATVGEFLTCHDAEAVQNQHIFGLVDEVCTCCGFLFCQDPGNYTCRNRNRQPFLSDPRKKDPPRARNVLPPQCYDMDSVESGRGRESQTEAPVSTVIVFHSALDQGLDTDFVSNDVSQRVVSSSVASYRTKERMPVEEQEPLILIVDEDEDGISRKTHLAARDDVSTPSRRYIRNSPMVLSYAPPEQTASYGNLTRANHQTKWSQVPQSQLPATSSKHLLSHEGQRKRYYPTSYERFRTMRRRGSIDEKISARSMTVSSESPRASSMRIPGRDDDSIESDTVRAVAPDKFHILDDPSSFIFQEEMDFHPSVAPQVIMFEKQPPFSMFQQ